MRNASDVEHALCTCIWVVHVHNACMYKYIMHVCLYACMYVHACCRLTKLLPTRPIVLSYEMTNTCTCPCF